VASYRLTAHAEQDFADIYRYSLQNFGAYQAENYAIDLTDGFEIIAQNPHSGRLMTIGTEEARRLARCYHSIYYEIEADIVTILRILHQSQDPMRHF